jgi:hypothetical protein
MQIPDLEEVYAFKKCVRKFASVKMRQVTYYNQTLHKDEDMLFKNLRMLKPFMNLTQQVVVQEPLVPEATTDAKVQ